MAHKLTDFNENCAICGIPSVLIRMMFQRRWPMPHRRYSRLSVDNLNPGERHTLENTRIVCVPCNVIRGANRKSDANVRAEMQRTWALYLPPRLLSWARG